MLDCTVRGLRVHIIIMSLLPSDYRLQQHSIGPLHGSHSPGSSPDPTVAWKPLNLQQVASTSFTDNRLLFCTTPEVEIPCIRMDANSDAHVPH
jgi:hypothetical protein